MLILELTLLPIFVLLLCYNAIIMA